MQEVKKEKPDRKKAIKLKETITENQKKNM